jgi:hypothetical protein
VCEHHGLAGSALLRGHDLSQHSRAGTEEERVQEGGTGSVVRRMLCARLSSKDCAGKIG